MKCSFDTSVQRVKYNVLREVARQAFENRLDRDILTIAKKIVPGPKATTRCCIYKEREIINERVKLATGGDKNNPNVVEVLSVACDECPITQMVVTEACRGCLAHNCMNSCPKDAISIINHKAVINQDKCIRCGKCISSCQYNAIRKNLRPCESACKVNAIKVGNDDKTYIDYNECISCGACVYTCPFGAIMDKSFILETIDILKKSESNTRYKVYAVVAPSIAGQFTHNIESIVSGIKQLGFYSVVEAALGADIVAYLETKELIEKGFLTSSCCPAFVKYIENKFPKMLQKVSHNVSPMVEISKRIKESDPNSKIVFIGPCIGKKAERQKEDVKNIVDNVITFEELQALFDSRDVDLEILQPEPLENASYYGRLFAKSGGLSGAVEEAVKELNIDDDNFRVNTVICNGIEECKIALMKASKGILKENFIEGMVCKGGCVGGPGCLTHGVKDTKAVDNYGKEAIEKNILDSIQVFDIKE